MEYVTTGQHLKEILGFIECERRLAVDTEADSLHRYSEKLCLVQVSTHEKDFVFDPLADVDLTPLIYVLKSKELFFHGADFDLRMLFKAYGFKATKIFDSMIAAQMLGYTSFGLASLAEKFCDVKLSKSNQKADWSKRPLTESMLRYAANDTHYLYRIALRLEEELIERDRTAWLHQTCANLLEQIDMTPRTAREDRWRIKGSGNLRGKELVFLKTLWDWREETARAKDRPSFKVLNNDAMIEIAKWKAHHAADPLAKMPGLSRQLKERDIEVLDAAFDAAAHLSADTLKSPKSGDGTRRLSNLEKLKLKQLKDARKKIALELNCDSSILASNFALEKIVISSPQDREAIAALNVLRPWQSEIVTAPFLDALNQAEEQGAPEEEERVVDIEGDD